MERRGRAAITRHKDSISRATQILGTRIKTWGWMTELASCLRERENIFLRERRLVLVVNEDRTRIDGSDSGAICHITARSFAAIRSLVHLWPH